MVSDFDILFCYQLNRFKNLAEDACSRVNKFLVWVEWIKISRTHVYTVEKWDN